MPTEAELLSQIANTDIQRQAAKAKIQELKDALVKAEDQLIEATITKDRLQEELRIYREITVPAYTPDERELEIERFRQRFPELCNQD